MLGIDTSTKVGGLGLYDSEKGLIGENNLTLERTHSERLMPMLEMLLKAADLTVQDLDGFAVTLGPGSFTGIRIGVTTAKTLAQITEKPIVGVSTLEVTAFNLVMTPGLICPIFDARNRRVYTARFYGNQGGLERITEDASCTIDQLVDELKDEKGPIYFVGDAVSLYKDMLRSELRERVLFPPYSLQLPRGGTVAELGYQALNRGKKDDLFALTPNYLKPSQAEINWQKKYGKQVK
ncbi:tRNA (adenosine(37)-N6)-threonylcarbamoyltransferase complex dimerization subunit type 1 TsaB [Anoxybacter fermentans]|uniref:tRNA (adenosine(37)-N6)-threonylcarbamoyltransferase complex dimerization subunit type 1 TsaB n=1 Tax=Anoxybacter fermentans TaxID=1323375 RepID=UPI001F020AC7|nr:tRNA (adenosine(37)-N6)-threonylcarbamoyltransferase complex dimerization subunit type 1 TsaB [Anoxybacter fermentans]